MKVKVYKITESPLSEIEKKIGVVPISPVMGARLDAAEYFEILSRNYSTNRRIITPAEVGCTMSHLKIYELIVSERISAIILENDICATKEALACAERVSAESKVDFVHLGWHPNIHKGIWFKGRYEQKIGLYRVDPNQDFYGTFAYFVSPRAAFELLAFHRDLLRKADSWREFFKQSTISPYFYGAFAHPIERGTIGAERSMLREAPLYKLIAGKALTLLRVVIQSSTARLRGYRVIKPMAVDRSVLGGPANVS